MQRTILISLYLFMIFSGGLLMANELLVSKIIATSFGNSIQSWAILLSVTLLSLAAGYYFGGALLKNRERILKKSLFINGGLLLFQFLLTLNGEKFSGIFLEMGFTVGMTLFTALLIFPLALFLGANSPLTIELIAGHSSQNAGEVAGRVYGISTLGGVAATFIIGLSILPLRGVTYTNNLLLGMISINLLILLLAALNQKRLKN
jgi:hypothetical protein